MIRFFNKISTAIYAVVTLLLVFFAFLIIGVSLYKLFVLQMDEVHFEEDFTLSILQTVGAIIIAVAILDVAKYMVEEEVFRNKQLRTPREARETLTKIIVIISIAVAVEGLIYIFKAGSQDMRLLLYPATLILSSTLMVVGLGIYQKLSTGAEALYKREVKKRD